VPGKDEQTGAHVALRLLWAPRQPRKRGLTADAIVSAGVALADREGLDAVSMRRVADELGAGTMSLYRHVPGKNELLELMFDRVIGEGGGVEPPEGTWRERLETIVWESWRLYHRHPWVIAVSQTRPPLGPGVLDSYEQMLRAIDGVGLSGRDMNASCTLLSDYCAGAARRAISESQEERLTGVSTESWWESRASFWEEYFDPQRYRTISRIYEEGAYDDGGAGFGEDAFAYGLAVILDGIEARIGAARSPGPA
jgi:AcrR family transcriptional regulator